jgi:hypothetical protein
MFGLKYALGLIVFGSIIAGFFIFSTLYLNKKGSKTKIWTLRVIIILMLVLEFVKFVRLLSIKGSIGQNEFPFYFCSMGLYLFPIVAFGNNTKAGKFLTPAAFIFGILGGSFVLLYPANVLDIDIPWSYDYFFNEPVISYLYHSLFFMFSLYLVTSKIYIMKKYDFFKAIIVINSLALVAILLNSQIEGADYFMIGMAYGVPFPLSAIRQYSHPLYILTMMAIGIVFSFCIYARVLFKKEAKIETCSSQIEG